ncbi:MAG: HAMP domain-containing protein, partial [Phycisphaerales bacterium]|nr:HAMP domain-containing protein [Phycisphaerales bacterium]
MRIATRIRWLVLGVVVVTATAIGVVLFWGYARIVERQQRDSIARRVHLESERIGAAFEEIRHDVTLLSNLSLATRLLVDRDDEAGRTRLGEFFVDMLEAKPNYAQVRLISGDDGREIVRADRDPTTGAVRIAPRDALQDKADEPYHRAAVARPPGTTFLAETTLNREHGTITMPLQPMMRATITIGDETGRSRGYVIINIDFRRFVAVLMPERKDDILLLANADGDYLVHPDETRTFGFDRGRRHRLTDDFAGVEALLGETPAKTSVRTRDAAGRFAHFQRIDGQVDVRDQTLIFGIVGSEAAVADRAAVVAWRALGITAILLLAALCVASWLAHRLVRPLHDLTSAADALVETPDAVALPALDRADEIGVLARAFRNMIDRLGERERRLRAAGARIDRANRDLDHFARIAAHDLREPARRIAGMVDAVAGRESGRLTPAGAA